MKTLLGVLIGILIMTGLLWCFRQVGTGVAMELGHVYEPRSGDWLNEEKITALNKRLDDLLIFGGIIITLLLAINAGVFVNAERQVESYMRRNYQVHLDRIRAANKSAEDMLGNIRRELNLKSSVGSNDATEQNNSHEKQKYPGTDE